MSKSKLIEMLSSATAQQMNKRMAAAYLCHLLITRKDGFYGSGVLSSLPDGWRLSDTMLATAIALLDAEGWVICNEQKVVGRGRPRKIYTIAPGAEEQVKESANYWGSS